MFKVNNKNTRTTSMTSFGVYIVNFEHISETFTKITEVSNQNKI